MTKKWKKRIEDVEKLVLSKLATGRDRLEKLEGLFIEESFKAVVKRMVELEAFKAQSLRLDGASTEVPTSFRQLSNTQGRLDRSLGSLRTEVERRMSEMGVQAATSLKKLESTCSLQEHDLHRIFTQLKELEAFKTRTLRLNGAAVAREVEALTPIDQVGPKSEHCPPARSVRSLIVLLAQDIEWHQEQYPGAGASMTKEVDRLIEVLHSLKTQSTSG